MREIKFRYVFKYEESTASFCIGIKDIENGSVQRVLQQIDADLSKFTLLYRDEFTGLYDCEGKEIYEGDALLIPEGYGGDYHYHEIECIVKYDAPCFFVECGQDFNWRDTKIIGNIHEV